MNPTAQADPEPTGAVRSNHDHYAIPLPLQIGQTRQVFLVEGTPSERLALSAAYRIADCSEELERAGAFLDTLRAALCYEQENASVGSFIALVEHVQNQLHLVISEQGLIIEVLEPSRKTR